MPRQRSGSKKGSKYGVRPRRERTIVPVKIPEAARPLCVGQIDNGPVIPIKPQPWDEQPERHYGDEQQSQWDGSVVQIQSGKNLAHDDRFDIDGSGFYFNFSSRVLATLLIASLIIPGSGRFPCARLGRPPPRPPMDRITSPALSPRLTRSSVTTEMITPPEVSNAIPFWGYFSRNLSARVRKVSTFEFGISIAITLTPFSV